MINFVGIFSVRDGNFFLGRIIKRGKEERKKLQVVERIQQEDISLQDHLGSPGIQEETDTKRNGRARNSLLVKLCSSVFVDFFSMNVFQHSLAMYSDIMIHTLGLDLIFFIFVLDSCFDPNTNP